MKTPRLLFLIVCLMLVTFVASAESPFEPDPALGKNARTWAQEFVTFAENQYGESLVWEEVSIKYLDEIVDDLHAIYVRENPSEEEITPVARSLGCFIGEIYRTYNGGKWGWLTLESGSFPAIESELGAHFLPLGKSLDRIKTGSDPDIWEYYQHLTTQ